MGMRVMDISSLSRFMGLMATTSVLAMAAGTSVRAQNCTVSGGQLQADCTHTNAGETVSMPTQPNTEIAKNPPVPSEGFVIRVDGDVLVGDKKVEDTKRKADIALEQADVQIKFDGLDVKPRLDAQILGDKTAFRRGERAVFQSRTNYPGWIRRSEIRIIDERALYGRKTVAVIPITPNGQASYVVSADEGLMYVHRVYDERGRFDETAPAALNERSRRGLEGDVEEGSDSTVTRNIPVFGGAVTVFGENIAQGSRIRTLGEEFRPSDNNKFVIQRILPPGDHTVNVEVLGGAQDTFVQRDIEIPKSEWFFVGLADITVGKILQDDLAAATPGEKAKDTYARGRLAFYLKGKIKGEYLLTAAADTGEDDLENLFRDLDEKDARSLLLRIDPDKYYPVYGDDSTYEEDAPTEGKFYIRLEKDESHIMWGNFKSEIRGTHYLRNERTLYGAQGVYKSPAVTENGEAKLAVELFAAQPDMLPQRDVFRGTGGSSYFLKFQDVSIGSETVTVEIRDDVTGRVIERKTLVYGVDYDINYAQGLILLKRPLSGSGASGGIVVGNPNGDSETRLVVQYEHTPVLTNVDTFSYGGRVQTWVTDKLRFGASYMAEDQGGVDQVAYGADILYKVSETTFAEFEYAKSRGPGFGYSYSTDGGLIIDDTAGAGGNGRAIRFNGQLDLADLNKNVNGVIGGYYEDRTAGFSTLDYNATTDQQLWGVYGEFTPSQKTRLRFYSDNFEDTNGERKRESGIEFGYQQTDQLLWELGVEHVDQADPTDPTLTGKRLDAALRATYTANTRLTYWGFVQGTLYQSGAITRNNRIGAGLEYQVTDRLSLSGEVSDGTTGVGARFLASYDRDENNSYYFGYTLDPEREFGGNKLNGDDKGSFVIGARRQINESVSTFAENSYDLFGTHKSLTGTYGVDYTPTDFITYTGGFEFGNIKDTINGDFERTAVSFGFRYKDEAATTARGRIEYRRERGGTLALPNNRDSDTWLLSAGVRHKISEQARFLANFDGVYSDSNQASLRDARYAEVSVGYAFRPIDNDKLNILAKYTYLYDMTGQTINGTTSVGPRQRSHVFSFDASYDLDNHWTLGGKIGARFANSSPNSTVAFTQNDALLLLGNVRYHTVHKWDMLFEVRALKAKSSNTTDLGALAAVYRHMGNNFKLGIGYNFGRFSDDLRDLTYDDRGVFINAIMKY